MNFSFFSGFVSGVVSRRKEIYLLTDVGGAYKYDYENKKWITKSVISELNYNNNSIPILPHIESFRFLL